MKRGVTSRRLDQSWYAWHSKHPDSACSGPGAWQVRQAAMALDSLYIAYSREARPANSAEVRAAISALFQQLENPSAYNADQFARGLRRVGTLLR